MKHIKTLAIVSVLGLALDGFALAQDHRAATENHHGDATALTKHLSEAYTKFAPFDANKEGKLDSTEKDAVAKAITDGTLQIPDHTPPNGVKPDAKKMLDHFATVYAYLASLDANHDGVLDATEQAALKSAIEKGELAKLHGEPPHGDDEHHR